MALKPELRLLTLLLMQNATFVIALAVEGVMEHTHSGLSPLAVELL